MPNNSSIQVKYTELNNLACSRMYLIFINIAPPLVRVSPWTLNDQGEIHNGWEVFEFWLGIDMEVQDSVVEAQQALVDPLRSNQFSGG